MPGVITVEDFDDNQAWLSSVVTGGVPPYSYAWHMSDVEGFTPSESTLITDETEHCWAYGFDGPSINVLGLAEQTTYYFKLVVTDSQGNTSTTPEVSVTTNETGWAQELQPSSMATAHTALTDGVGETEVQLYADSTELPKASYGADEICWYGVNQPNNTGAQPGNGGNAAVYFGHLVDAGILGNRLEAQWDNIEIDPASPSWSTFNGYLTAIRNVGGTAIVETSYTPMHRTGQRYRNCPPLVFNNTPQAASFVADEIALTGKPVWLTQSAYERRGFAVVETGATPTSVSEEGLAFRYTTPEQNNFTRTAAQGFSDMYVAETAHWPIDITSLVVEVETSAGSGTYEEWTRVADIQDGTSGQKCYVADFTGRIGFKDGRMSSVCAAPATGAKVRASYDYFAQYNFGTEYTLDAIAGTLSRAGASGFSVPQPSDGFSSFSPAEEGWNPGGLSDYTIDVANMSDGFAGPSLNAGWSFDVTPTYTVDGALNVSAAASGVYVLTQSIVGAPGDFELVVKITASSSTGAVGLRIQGSNPSNDRVTVFRNSSGELNLSIYNGGSGTSSKMGWAWAVPLTIHVKKVGTDITAWAEESQDSHNYLTGTINWTPASVGLYLAGGASGSSISVDDWLVKPIYRPTVLEVSSNKLSVGLASGQTAYYAQDITGSGSFDISMVVGSFGAGGAQVNARVGFRLYQDANNYLDVAVQCGGSGASLVKFYVAGKTGGVNVTGAGSDGSSEATTVTIRAVYDADTGQMVCTMRPKTDYATDRTFTMTDFAPVTMGLRFFSEPQRGPQLTCTIDDWALVTPSGVPDDVDIYSICADTDAIEAWGAALATQCSGKAKYFSYGNEVTNGAGWTWDGTLALYAECLKAFRTGVKSIIADAQVGFAGFADAQFGQMTTLLASLANADYDFAEGHFYKFDEGSIAAWKSARPDDFISRLAAAGDSAKPIFDGEMSAPCGVLATSDAKGHANGPREKRQVEETIQMLMYQRAKGFLGVALWPGTDLEAKGVNEGNKWGGKDGLFYTTAGDAIPNGIKPVYYAVRNLAQCKGILVDLGAVETVGSVVLACSDRSQVESVRVLGSLTCTDATSAPPKVTAALTGGTSVFVVDVIDGDGALVTETWQAVCNAEGTFDVTGSVSGAQGTATKGVLFESDNTVCSFTIPDATYTEGQTFEWGTFKGDDFAQLGTAEGAAGAGDITVDCGDASARYLLIEFTRAVGALYIGLKQVTVLDDADAEITPAGYVVEGWQAGFIPA